MPEPQRGEVWIADLGLAAKVRPVLVFSVPYSDRDYALVTVVPHTTSARGSDFEVSLRVPKLKPGAFNVQGLMAVPAAKFIRPIATLQPAQISAIEDRILSWLGMGSGNSTDADPGGAGNG